MTRLQTILELAHDGIITPSQQAIDDAAAAAASAGADHAEDSAAEDSAADSANSPMNIQLQAIECEAVIKIRAMDNLDGVQGSVEKLAAILKLRRECVEDFLKQRQQEQEDELQLQGEDEEPSQAGQQGCKYKFKPEWIALLFSENGGLEGYKKRCRGSKKRARVVHGQKVIDVVVNGSDWSKCPISMNTMKHPIVISCGHTFEEEAILRYKRQQLNNGRRTWVCPLCRRELTRNYSGSPNIALKGAIDMIMRMPKRMREHIE